MNAVRCFLLMLCLTIPCLAAEEGWRVQVQLVRLIGSREKLDFVMDQSHWDQKLRTGAMEVLESTTLIVPPQNESGFFLGRKFPVAYPDPRTGSHQAQYVDVGFHVDISATSLGDGRLQLQCNMSKRTLADEKSNLPPQDNSSCQSPVLLRPGQVGIASSTRGRVGVKFLKSLYPGHNLSDKDTFVWTLSLQPY